ncbi:MAG: hypothetical protein KC646_00245 [Candidatus Cloacimonetes bacterium]|nr:hypothetical protein [Candidatus Cloacimonadota bacterium]
MKILIIIFSILGSISFAGPAGYAFPEPISLKLRFSQAPELNRLVKLRLNIKALLVDLKITNISFDSLHGLDFSHTFNRYDGFLIKAGQSKTVEFYVKQKEVGKDYTTLQSKVSFEWPKESLAKYFLAQNPQAQDSAVLDEINSMDGVETINGYVNYYSSKIESIKEDISIYRGVILKDSSIVDGLYYYEPWMKAISIKDLKFKIDEFEKWLALLDSENLLEGSEHVAASQLEDHFFNYYCLALREIGLDKPKQLLKRLSMIVDIKKLHKQKSLSKSMVAILSLQANMYLKLNKSKKAYSLFKTIITKANNLYDSRYAYYQLAVLLKDKPTKAKQLLKKSLSYNSGFTLAKSLLKSL